MMKSLLLVLLSLGFALAGGCAAGRSGEPLDGPARVVAPWEPTPTTHVRFTLQQLGRVPNSGLQLPVISPDGGWIAFLRISGSSPVDPAATFDGHGLERVGLSIRQLVPKAEPRLVCDSGVAWHCFSTDGSELIFIRYTQPGTCEVGLYEVASGQTRWLRPELPRLIMPALEGSGGRLAAVSYSVSIEDARVHVIDLDTGLAMPVPKEDEYGPQLWPCWQDEQTLLYLKCTSFTIYLKAWRPTNSLAELLSELDASGSSRSALSHRVSLGSALSPNGRRLAYYESAADRIIIADFARGTSRRLKPKTRAGCWLDDQYFLAATDQALWLIGPTENYSRILDGRWLPRWGDGQTGEAILCGAGPSLGVFELVKLKLLPAR